MIRAHSECSPSPSRSEPIWDSRPLPFQSEPRDTPTQLTPHDDLHLSDIDVEMDVDDDAPTLASASKKKQTSGWTCNVIGKYNNNSFLSN